MSPKDNNKQVSAAVRILQQKRDASARATHLMVKNDPLITYEKAFSGQADEGKFPKSTFLERKTMSTKTITKRIALVAVAALAIGGLSTVSANAATTIVVRTTAEATPMALVAADSGAGTSAATATMTGTAIAGPFNYVLLESGTNVASGSTLGVTIESTTGARLSVQKQPSAGVETVTVATDGLSATSTGRGDTTVLRISTPAVGTIVAKVNRITDNSGVVTVTALQTITITVNAASVVGALSVANSTSFISDSITALSSPATAAELATAAGQVTADAAILKSRGTAGTPAKVAVILVTLKDTQASPAAIAGATLSASVSGSGLIDGGDATDLNQTPARVATAVTNSAGITGFMVYSDGSSGAGTITITHTSAAGVTTEVAKETVTFFSSTVATVSNAQVLKIGRSVSATALGASAAYTSSSTRPAFTVTLRDSNSNIVSGGCANILLSVADTKVFSSTVTNATEEGSTGLTGAGVCDITITSAAGSVAGTSTTVTPYVLAADGVTKINGTPMTFTVGGIVASSIAASFDKAEYAIGDLVTMTLTATDSTGKALADGSYLVFDTTTSGAFGTSAQLTSAPFSNGTIAFNGGTASATFFAPFTTGDVKMSATLSTTSTSLATALRATKLETSIAVAGSDATASLALDAANAATDAANNAYDEAQNATQAASDALAAVTALAAQVKSLIASVKKLTAAVAKLRR
jgi:hypothetical protein